MLPAHICTCSYIYTFYSTYTFYPPTFPPVHAHHPSIYTHFTRTYMYMFMTAHMSTYTHFTLHTHFTRAHSHLYTRIIHLYTLTSPAHLRVHTFLHIHILPCIHILPAHIPTYIRASSSIYTHFTRTSTCTHMLYPQQVWCGYD